jgi:hypothetical protein
MADEESETAEISDYPPPLHLSVQHGDDKIEIQLPTGTDSLADASRVASLLWTLISGERPAAPGGAGADTEPKLGFRAIRDMDEVD